MGYERQMLHPLSVKCYNSKVQRYNALTIMYASLTQFTFRDFVRLLKSKKHDASKVGSAPETSLF